MFYKFDFTGGSSATATWLEKDSQNLVIFCAPDNNQDQCFYVNPSIHKRTNYLRAKLRHLDGGRSHMYSWKGKLFLVFKKGDEMILRWSTLSSVHDKGNLFYFAKKKGK